MGDGGKCGKGFHLNTNVYLMTESALLINTLKTNFDLNCTIHSRNRIYIPAKEMNKFKELVTIHFLEGFKYKLS